MSDGTDYMDYFGPDTSAFSAPIGDNWVGDSQAVSTQTYTGAPEITGGDYQAEVINGLSWMDSELTGVGAPQTADVGSFPTNSGEYEIATKGSDSSDASSQGDGWSLSKLWSDFKSLDNGTKSILASTASSALGGLFKGVADAESRNSSTAAKMRELDILQQQTDLKRQAQENAMHSTAESYDKSKYKVQGLLKPTTLKTPAATTGVTK